MEDILKESGRVSAFKLTRFINETKTEETVFIPQFELIQYKASSGDTVKESFVCIQDSKNKSGLSEFTSEIEALIYAVQYRNNLEF